MAGLTRQTPTPTRIVVHRRSRVLEVAFDDGTEARLPFEFLRVLSPSAEVRGHGPGQEVLQVGKREVDIETLEPVGNYAVKPRFSDGHETGIYSWDYLHHLATQHDRLWSDYLARLSAAGGSRDPATPVAPAMAGVAGAPLRVSGTAAPAATDSPDPSPLASVDIRRQRS